MEDSTDAVPLARAEETEDGITAILGETRIAFTKGKVGGGSRKPSFHPLQASLSSTTKGFL